MFVKRLKHKKILLLGFGREGQDTFLFLRKLFPKKIIGIADQNQYPTSNIRYLKKVRLHFGKDYLKAIKNYDIVIKSPGIPIHLPEIEKAFNQGKITSQTEIFLNNCPGKIIGVTGTKGKSTTASLIYKILKAGGIKDYLVGNIGKPVLTSLLKAKKDDVFVYELSSHQLYELKKSPHIAALLNIYPEHLDYYKNFKEYIKAKANITKYQTRNDFLIYNSKDKIVKKIAKKSKAKKIPIPANLPITICPNRCPLSNGAGIRIPSIVNLSNVIAAVEVAKIFDIPQKIVAKAIKEFKPLPHRLECVGKFKGIKFYNDSLSTIPQAAIEALDFFGDKVQTLILGGFDRGLDFKKLAERILASNVKTLILFPATGKRILDEFKKINKKGEQKCFFAENMKKAVSLTYKHTEKRKICLLSPASPSFGMFKDYKERGDLFKKWVKALGKRE